MSKYCEICGNELAEDEEEEGICEKCKAEIADEDYD